MIRNDPLRRWWVFGAMKRSRICRRSKSMQSIDSKIVGGSVRKTFIACFSPFAAYTRVHFIRMCGYARQLHGNYFWLIRLNALIKTLPITRNQKYRLDRDPGGQSVCVSIFSSMRMFYRFVMVQRRQRQPFDEWSIHSFAITSVLGLRINDSANVKFEYLCSHLTSAVTQCAPRQPTSRPWKSYWMRGWLSVIVIFNIYSDFQLPLYSLKMYLTWNKFRPARLYLSSTHLWDPTKMAYGARFCANVSFFKTAINYEFPPLIILKQPIFVFSCRNFRTLPWDTPQKKNETHEKRSWANAVQCPPMFTCEKLLYSYRWRNTVGQWVTSGMFQIM